MWLCIVLLLFCWLFYNSEMFTKKNKVPTTNFLSSRLFDRGRAELYVHTVAEQDEV